MTQNACRLIQIMVFIRIHNKASVEIFLGVSTSKARPFDLCLFAQEQTELKPRTLQSGQQRIGVKVFAGRNGKPNHLHILVAWFTIVLAFFAHGPSMFLSFFFLIGSGAVLCLLVLIYWIMFRLALSLVWGDRSAKGDTFCPWVQA